MGIRIIKPGFFTTIQDMGRFGYQRYGIPVSGVMDARSYAIANALVGNTGEAALEITMAGASIMFTTENVFAVTGADLSPCLNDIPIQSYCAIEARRGDILSFKERRTGCRAYIAFAGGLYVKPVMNSCSTYVKAKIGGYQGRRLMEEDEIPFLSPVNSIVLRQAKKESFQENTIHVRVIMGPQQESFTQEGIHTFLSSAYTVTEYNDRMGCRLHGPEIEFVDDGNIITDGICFGAIQVSSNGQPIVMMADRQTTGGYAKIANVITVDLPLLAQCIQGDSISFHQVSVNEAQQLYIKQLNFIKQIRCSAGNILYNKHIKKAKYYSINIDNKPYHAQVQEIK